MSSEGGPALRAVALAAVCLLASTLLVNCGGVSGLFPSKPVADEGPPRPRFDHAGHIERGLECIDCHEDAEDEDEPGMPDLEFCMECHEEIDEEKPKEQRASAWNDKEGNPVWSSFTKLPDYAEFDHLAHVEGADDCTDCHEGIDEATSVGPDLGFVMDDCTQCHEEQGRQTSCVACHADIDENWKPASHERMWDVLHGQYIRRGGTPETLAERCSMCHTESSCVQCHKEEAPRSHTQSWRISGGHGLAAAMDRTSCKTCHETNECITCHQTAVPRSHRGQWGSPRNRHCVNCHLPLRPASRDGCATCHDGTPSHREAPRQPPDHRPDLDCRECHRPMRHIDDGGDCNRCHR